VDYVWRPAAVLPGIPAAEPWTVLGAALGGAGDATVFYAGTAAIGFHRTETGNYIDNLASGVPQLWVVLRPTGAEPPYEVLAVTADPSEGEAYTEAGNDLVDTVPMPAEIRQALEAFVAEHHVERAFFKRQRDSGAETAPGRARKPRGTVP
jgi:uncharacterized protein DUF3305